MNLHDLGLVTALCAAGKVAAQTTIVVPNNIITGQDSIAQYVSGTSGLDGPKITPVVNSTSYDWWYFDAVSNDASMGIVVVFYLSTDLGFPLCRLDLLSQLISLQLSMMEALYSCLSATCQAMLGQQLSRQTETEPQECGREVDFHLMERLTCPDTR